jgi:Putative GTPase activating protein for Arf
MGTHISRVKSVDLDAWTDEQLQSVLKWGNSRANKCVNAQMCLSVNMEMDQSQLTLLDLGTGRPNWRLIMFPRNREFLPYCLSVSSSG